MSNSFKVTKWEIKKNITNKSFLVSILLTPIIMIIFGALPTLLERIETDRLYTVYIVDEIGIYSTLENIVPQDEINLIKYTGSPQSLEDKIKGNKHSSYIVFEENILNNNQITIYTADDSMPPTRILNNNINQAFQFMKLNEAGLTHEQINYINSPYALNSVSLEGGDQDFESKVFPAILAGLIYFSIFISGTMTFQSAVQEKRDKMTEVLLSSINPIDLMQGKILGCFVLGMIQVAAWLAFAIPIAHMYLDVPVFNLLLVSELPLMLFYSLIGYLLFSSIFVSMGATVEDLQSAGNFQGILFILPMLPVFFAGAVIANPHGIVARIGSFIPFSSPGVMLLRLVFATKVPTTDLLLSSIILIVTTLLTMKLAGKLFKTAILMYGKNATPAEIFRWIKQ